MPKDYQPMISGVILARNEEHNIEDCVRALRPHVSEILLIDMQSEDATVALASPLVERVLSHDLVPNFDSARNIAIPEVRNQWLWFVDADERISSRTGKLVNELVSDRGDEFEAINIPFKTWFCGKWIQHSGWWPGYTMPRVLKKGSFRFSEKLHGGVELDGREIRLPPDPDLGIEHFSYLSLNHYIEKFNRYTSTEAIQLHKAHQSTDWRNAVAHMMRDLWMYYEANQGVLDGRHGWLLAWLSGQYRWLSHAKLLDVDPNGVETGAELAPEGLDSVLGVMQQELERLRRGSPVLPLGVVWRSPIWDPSGYADEGRCIAKALAQSERHVSIEEIPWSDTCCEISSADRGLFRALMRSQRAGSNISITNCIPTLVDPDPAAALNIIRTTFETDRIPRDWEERLNRFDEIWVISEFNRRAFIRSGIAPEKIRCVPSFLDTQLYRPDGPKLQLPKELQGRFVFLSVFDWQLRKGWDLLIKSYCETFKPSDGTGLLLKISRAHGIGIDSVRDQINQVLSSLGDSIASRTDICIMDRFLSGSEMAEMYRAADAFVLPSRGEGWGRPYMEAMACGIPTIGTAASGNIDFMTDENSMLIPAELVDVPDDAVREISVYAGHKWYEPDCEKLKVALQELKGNDELRDRIAAAGQESVSKNNCIESGQALFDSMIDRAENRFRRPVLVQPEDSKVRVVWEGEFFAGHSFSNINEQLAPVFFEDSEIQVALDRKFYNPANDRHCNNLGQYQAHFDRSFEKGAHVVIRHAFPPNWNRPESGRWIHIQPWEFGHLPTAWIEPLREHVDEIWVPTHYVRRVFENSGIPSSRIHVIPWGFDPVVFTPNAPGRLLPTNKSFRFLFVGGTLVRKGYDRVLEAYTREFSPDDDVCLVVKDMGVDTFYRYGNLRNETIQARDRADVADIVYFDASWTPGQLASLYTACNCLVMPYRGEGFGLPILEAMACGLPPIVPRGGASDDFVTEETAFLLNSHEVETVHEWPLVGPPLELEIDVDELRSVMRQAYTNAMATSEKGQRAFEHVSANFTWQQTFSQMKERILFNAGLAQSERQLISASHVNPESCRQVSVCVKTRNHETFIADFLCSLKPFVEEIIVFDDHSTDRTAAIAREYGARVIQTNEDRDLQTTSALKFIKTDWYLWLEPETVLDDSASRQIAPLIKAQPKSVCEITMRAECLRVDQADKPAPKTLKFIRALRMKE